MRALGGAGRLRRRAAIRTAVALAVVGTTAVVAYLPQRAEATLAGSSFDATDASPTGDLAEGAVAISDPTGNQDTSNYTGSTEDDVCPALQAGTASPKDDLDTFYFGSESNASGAFLYVAWHRVATSGTTTIDFELNHASGIAPNCNGVNPPRTAGDRLITYDFLGSGPFTLDISQRTWIGTSTAGAWGPASSLPAGSFEASIDDDGAFGELAVNLTTANLLGTSGCESFATVFPKSRSSSQSFGNTIKEFVPPQKATVSNCGSIQILKQDDAGAVLQNVVFDLYTDVANAPGTAVVPAQSCTTGSDGKCTITDVFPGTYWVVERAAPTGYTGAAAQKVTVALAGNTPSGTLTFVNPRKPAQVNIQKNDDTGAALAGAGFTLYTDSNDEPGTAVNGKTCTTNGSGQCSITGILPPGTYWVVETTVPTNYTGADPQKVTLGLDQTVGLTFVNTRKPATVNIVKQDDAGAALQGAVFGLYTDDNGEAGSAVTGKTCTTGVDGKCSITGILPPGTYWVVETTTPTGHATADPQSVTLGLNQTVTLTFVDDRLPARVDIHKTDDLGAALQGAVFGLYEDDDDARGDAVAGKTCTTNAAGNCSITGILPPGTYWIHETTVPTGHTAADDQKVALALNQTVGLTFVNPRQPAAVNIVKKDDAGAALQGAVFGLYTDDNGEAGSAVNSKTCTTGADGKCSITGILPPATYWVVETTTPTGHATADPQSVTLGLNQTVTLNFVDDRKPAHVDIVKEDDAGARLQGAVFGLYEDDDGARGDAVVGKTCTTGVDGRCSITGILPPGLYWVHETTVPTGHTAAADQQVDLDLDETVTLTFVNPRKPATVHVVKTDDTGAALAGAVFGLYTDSDDAVGSAVQGKTCTTGVDGKCSITGILPPGLYWVVETTTPAGHYTADAQQVDLDLDETVTVEFENVRKPIGISLTKTVDGAAHPEDDPLFTESGQEVVYVLTIENTGELPLTITALTDSLNADVLDDCEQGLASELAAGDSFTCTYTAAPSEDTENDASVTGTDVLGRTTSSSDEAFVVPLHPAIRVEKSGPSGAHVGDVVTYTFTVTNPGDTGLDDVALVDERCADDPELQSKEDGDDDDTLEPGEVWTYTCQYTVVAADGASVTNTVEVSGTDRLDTTVTWDDEYVFPVLHPALTIDKTASPSSVAVSGTVTFSYLVTNTGDTTLFDISVDDDKLGHIGDIDVLAPGQSQTLSKTMTVAAGSPTVNVGTAVGSDRLGRKVSDDDSATITVVLGQTFVRTVDLPRTGASVDRWLKLSGLLLAAGATLVVAARRRRQSTSA